MATVTITIPDALMPRVRHALCITHGLPETNANAKEAIIRYVKATVAGVETFENTAAALDTVPPPAVDNVAT